MRVWTNTTFRALDLLSAPVPTGERDVPEVASLLATAAAAAVTLTLSRCAPGTRPLPIEAPLDEATATALSIGRPTYKPGQRALVPGEPLQLRFSLDGVSYTGTTLVVARFEPRENAVGYQLAMPASLVCDDRRRGERVSIAFGQPPVAELLNAPTHRPLADGVLVDLAIGGARVRGSIASPPRAGDRVLLRAKLSDDVRIHALGTVVHAGRRSDGLTDVGIKFTSDVPDLDRYLRDLAAYGNTRGAARSGPTEPTG